MALTRQDAVPAPFIRGIPVSLDPKTFIIYLVAELEKLQNTVDSLVNLVPQVAISAPDYPLNGMIRQAKAPWNPLGTGDALVKYVGGAWTAV